VHSVDDYIDRVIAIGAVGYLIKQSSAELLSKAIREAQKGNLAFRLMQWDHRRAMACC
jgi:DNA-binding NarL/FixJ family response regulator